MWYSILLVDGLTIICHQSSLYYDNSYKYYVYCNYLHHNILFLIDLLRFLIVLYEKSKLTIQQLLNVLLRLNSTPKLIFNCIYFPERRFVLNMNMMNMLILYLNIST